MSNRPIKKSVTLFEKVRRLNYIKRCSLFPLVNSTSVAEHSFHVALMSNVFASQLELRGIPIDVAACTSYALYHDVEETVTSDIPWHVKNHLRKHLEFDKVVESYVENDLSKHSFEVATKASQGCDGSLEWLVVKSCDIGELMLYCKEEYETGNQHLLEIMLNSYKELERLLSLIYLKIETEYGKGIKYEAQFTQTHRDFNHLINFCKSFEQ